MPPCAAPNLQSGSLDLIERLQPTDLQQLAGNPAIKSASVTELGYTGITLNVGDDKTADPAANTPLGNDKRVRQALNLSIDRNVLNQVVFSGAYLPGNQWVSPDNFYYDKDFPVTARDIPKAKALLKEAGVTGKVTVDFMVPSDSQAQQAAK